MTHEIPLVGLKVIIPGGPIYSGSSIAQLQKKFSKYFNAFAVSPNTKKLIYTFTSPTPRLFYFGKEGKIP